MQTERAVRPQIFRNKRAIFRAVPLFPFQRVGTQIPGLFAQPCFGRRVVAVLLFIYKSIFFSFRKMAYARPMLERWEEKRLVSCWQKQKEGFCNDRSTKKKFPKHCQRIYQTQSPRTLWRADSASRIDCKRGSIYCCKHFPFDQECFWNFQPENLPKWKAPLITPLIKATRGLLRRSPQACTCMRGSQWG